MNVISEQNQKILASLQVKAGKIIIKKVILYKIVADSLNYL